ncbi:MAG: hypothetical protein ACI4UO_01075, partial [Paludibacteraceae bacterium]
RINLDEAGTTYANGLILLPDSWTCPDGITFTTAMGSYDNNTFTLKQWQKLESAGAVFLPASGGRYNLEVYDVQLCGIYWSATSGGSDLALYLLFDSYQRGVITFNRRLGRTVRLVQDYVTYTVTATCNEEQGSISGNGTYPKGTEVTLEATANAGYTFKEWSDGNTDNPRTITLTEDVTLTAIFQEGEATRVAQTSAVSATRKVLCNGQILILRNGNTYKITGQRVK